ncbi:MAG: isocitrate/isopropylmalate family dehydrogenase [Pseudomonadota bacterium]
MAVIPGDGIGHEIIPPTLELLTRAQDALGGFKLKFETRTDVGAGHFRDTGEDMSAAAFDAAGAADAILLGAIGLPDVRHPDGTEIAPHLKMRDRFGLYGGVRPVKAYPNTPQRLADPRAASIDLIILRESTEGLFYSHGRGEMIGDQEARETLSITRPVTEKLCDLAFALARRRREKGGKGHVTCVDKANVFRAFAFFRKIFTERAARHPDIDHGFAYVDAQALDLIRQPWAFDVLVMENMFGDILSDLGGGLVGGMGMASCAELGDEHALFQPAHGTAPDIAGQDKANPLATILSGALMLDWLAQRHSIPEAGQAADAINGAVEDAFATGGLAPMEFGGPQGTKEAARTVAAALERRLDAYR